MANENRRAFIAGAAGVVVGAGATYLATSGDKPAPKKAEAPKTPVAPAVNKQRIEMTMVTTWPRDFPGLGLSAQRLAQRIGEISDGHFAVEYFAAGERVGAFDVFDEVASGNSQAYIGAEYYWGGKHAGFNYFTAVPFGMSTQEWTAWVLYGGGQALW
ncbi:MAG: hypothetical protein EBU57_12445, partial [Alphaproteobacteria bacterium]|nr:hypothetical protein [Alphaproteobacteria bacterium]